MVIMAQVNNQYRVQSFEFKILPVSALKISDIPLIKVMSFHPRPR